MLSLFFLSFLAFSRLKPERSQKAIKQALNVPQTQSEKLAFIQNVLHTIPNKNTLISNNKKSNIKSDSEVNYDSSILSESKSFVQIIWPGLPSDQEASMKDSFQTILSSIGITEIENLIKHEQDETQKYLYRKMISFIQTIAEVDLTISNPSFKNIRNGISTLYIINMATNSEIINLALPYAMDVAILGYNDNSEDIQTVKFEISENSNVHNLFVDMTKLEVSGSSFKVNSITLSSGSSITGAQPEETVPVLCDFASYSPQSSLYLSIAEYVDDSSLSNIATVRFEASQVVISNQDGTEQCTIPYASIKGLLKLYSEPKAVEIDTQATNINLGQLTFSFQSPNLMPPSYVLLVYAVFDADTESLKLLSTKSIKSVFAKKVKTIHKQIKVDNECSIKFTGKWNQLSQPFSLNVESRDESCTYNSVSSKMDLVTMPLKKPDFAPIRNQEAYDKDVTSKNVILLYPSLSSTSIGLDEVFEGEDLSSVLSRKLTQDQEESILQYIPFIRHYRKHSKEFIVDTTDSLASFSSISSNTKHLYIFITEQPTETLDFSTLPSKMDVTIFSIRTELGSRQLKYKSRHAKADITDNFFTCVDPFSVKIKGGSLTGKIGNLNIQSTNVEITQSDLSVGSLTLSHCAAITGKIVAQSTPVLFDYTSYVTNYFQEDQETPKTFMNFDYASIASFTGVALSHIEQVTLKDNGIVIDNLPLSKYNSFTKKFTIYAEPATITVRNEATAPCLDSLVISYQSPCIADCFYFYELFLAYYEIKQFDASKLIRQKIYNKQTIKQAAETKEQIVLSGSWFKLTKKFELLVESSSDDSVIPNTSLLYKKLGLIQQKLHPLFDTSLIPDYQFPDDREDKFLDYNNSLSNGTQSYLMFYFGDLASEGIDENEFREALKFLFSNEGIKLLEHAIEVATDPSIIPLLQGGIDLVRTVRGVDLVDSFSFQSLPSGITNLYLIAMSEYSSAIDLSLPYEMDVAIIAYNDESEAIQKVSLTGGYMSNVRNLIVDRTELAILNSQLKVGAVTLSSESFISGAGIDQTVPIHFDLDSYKSTSSYTNISVSEFNDLLSQSNINRLTFTDSQVKVVGASTGEESAAQPSIPFNKINKQLIVYTNPRKVTLDFQATSFGLDSLTISFQSPNLLTPTLALLTYSQLTQLAPSDEKKVRTLLIKKAKALKTKVIKAAAQSDKAEIEFVGNWDSVNSKKLHLTVEALNRNFDIAGSIPSSVDFNAKKLTPPAYAPIPNKHEYEESLPTPEPQPAPDNGGGGLSGGAIGGIVAGGVAAIAGGITGVLCCKKKEGASENQTNELNENLA